MLMTRGSSSRPAYPQPPPTPTMTPDSLDIFGGDE
jgi:hypothetical protein